MTREYVINYLSNKLACASSSFGECADKLCEKCPYNYDLSKADEVFAFVIDELSKCRVKEHKDG